MSMPGMAESDDQENAVTGAILAGGKSRRMGRHKLFVRAGGVPLFDRVHRVLDQVFSDIIVVANKAEWFDAYDVRVVPDVVPGRGALGGIYTALQNASGAHCFCFAADMPFLNPRLIRHMITRSQEGDVIIPITPGGLQPLHAIYSRACLGPIEKLLSMGDLKIIDFFRDVTVIYLSEREINPYDPTWMSFLNINTEADLRRAEEILKGGL
jgi:molybdopterin-guanine dinucleotide biosynthesis protein A